MHRKKFYISKYVKSYVQYGNPDENGNWDGLIREVMIGPNQGGADFAVADLSVTSARSSAVQFSMPWMTLGKRTKINLLSITYTYYQKNF